MTPEVWLAGLWDNSVVPIRHELVEQDGHVAFEFFGGLTARFGDILDDANRHPKTSLCSRLFHRSFP